MLLKQASIVDTTVFVLFFAAAAHVTLAIDRIDCTEPERQNDLLILGNAIVQCRSREGGPLGNHVTACIVWENGFHFEVIDEEFLGQLYESSEESSSHEFDLTPVEMCNQLPAATKYTIPKRHKSSASFLAIVTNMPDDTKIIRRMPNNALIDYRELAKFHLGVNRGHINGSREHGVSNIGNDRAAHVMPDVGDNREHVKSNVGSNQEHAVPNIGGNQERGVLNVGGYPEHVPNFGDIREHVPNIGGNRAHGVSYIGGYREHGMPNTGGNREHAMSNIGGNQGHGVSNVSGYPEHVPNFGGNREHVPNIGGNRGHGVSNIGGYREHGMPNFSGYREHAVPNIGGNQEHGVSNIGGYPEHVLNSGSDRERVVPNIGGHREHVASNIGGNREHVDPDIGGNRGNVAFNAGDNREHVTSNIGGYRERGQSNTGGNQGYAAFHVGDDREHAASNIGGYREHAASVISSNRDRGQLNVSGNREHVASNIGDPQIARLTCSTSSPNVQKRVHIESNAWVECNGSAQKLTKCIIKQKTSSFEAIDLDHLKQLVNNEMFRHISKKDAVDFCNGLSSVEGYYQKIVDLIGESSISKIDFEPLLKSAEDYRITIKNKNGMEFEFRKGNDNIDDIRLDCSYEKNRHIVYINRKALTGCVYNYYRDMHLNTITKCIIKNNPINGEIEYLNNFGLRTLGVHEQFINQDDDQLTFCNKLSSQYEDVKNILGIQNIFRTTFNTIVTSTFNQLSLYF